VKKWKQKKWVEEMILDERLKEKRRWNAEERKKMGCAWFLSSIIFVSFFSLLSLLMFLVHSSPWKILHRRGWTLFNQIFLECCREQDGGLC
jgi:hypothetical protein